MRNRASRAMTFLAFPACAGWAALPSRPAAAGRFGRTRRPPFRGKGARGLEARGAACARFTTTQKAVRPRATLYQEITHRMLYRLEEGSVPWVQPRDGAKSALGLPLDWNADLTRCLPLAISVCAIQSVAARVSTFFASHRP